ncbi:hypothetical protein [Armatimonas sp.]|uniref:hypothetical protein n=1 Tax=Armatimonas sp. TaxID=1872638 RepID=UPI0037500EF5
MSTAKLMSTVVFYDTKPYDREYFENATGVEKLHYTFHEFRLTTQTVASADGAEAVCVFVNDLLDAPCLKQLEEGFFFEDYSGEIARVTATNFSWFAHFLWR